MDSRLFFCWFLQGNDKDELYKKLAKSTDSLDSLSQSVPIIAFSKSSGWHIVSAQS